MPTPRPRRCPAALPCIAAMQPRGAAPRRCPAALPCGAAPRRCPAALRRCCQFALPWSLDQLDLLDLLLHASPSDASPSALLPQRGATRRRLPKADPPSRPRWAAALGPMRTRPPSCPQMPHHPRREAPLGRSPPEGKPQRVNPRGHSPEGPPGGGRQRSHSAPQSGQRRVGRLQRRRAQLTRAAHAASHRQ